MKYYSDKTKKLYSEMADLEAAEKEYDEAHAAEIREKEAAKKDAEAVKKAYDAVVVARKHYVELVNQFAKEHKGYRLTITDDDYFDNLLDNLFRW